MDSNKIGKLIAKQRTEKNLSQEQLAEKLNISRVTISKWERGIRIPDSSIILQLSEILDIEVVELLKGEKNVKNNEIGEVTVDAIKYSVNSTKKKYILLAFIIIIFLIFFFSLGFYLYNYNKLTERSINTCQNDVCVEGIILTNSHKDIIFIKSIEFNNEYVGTEDDILTDNVIITLLSDDNVIIKLNKDYDEKISLSEILMDTYFYIDTTDIDYKVDLNNLILKIECDDSSFEFNMQI